MAGSRPGVDAMAVHYGVSSKALATVAGETMVSRVARTLNGHSGIARVLIFAQDFAVLQADPQSAWMADAPRIAFRTSAASISETIMQVMEQEPGPFLVTTADHVLLDHVMIDAFLRGAEGADIAVGVVERQVLLAAHPQSRRTWLKFRGGAYSGANIFFLRDRRALAAIAVWREIEQQRKKARAVIGAFGPLILAGAALRILSFGQAIRMAGRRLGLKAAVVAIPIAEACIDADKPDDVTLIEAIIAARSAA